KTDIQDISNPMGLVMRLKGVTYKYDIDGNPTKNFKTGRHYGFIAEDVQRIVPEAVQKTFNEEGNIDDFVVMNYDMIVPILIEGMKSQQETIRNLESRILVLEEITGAGARAGAAEAKDDEDTTVSLGQNRPNPFKGMTTIDYTIPASMNNARLVVYDANGSVIETIALDPGAGTVDYNAGRLSAGIYFYAIEADGQNLARQMMVVK
ncbi:MAG: tail fiber domain-containing protein, partial [Bacteroidota bacterium]